MIYVPTAVAILAYQKVPSYCFFRHFLHVCSTHCLSSFIYVHHQNFLGSTLLYKDRSAQVSQILSIKTFFINCVFVSFLFLSTCGMPSPVSSLYKSSAIPRQCHGAGRRHSRHKSRNSCQAKDFWLTRLFPFVACWYSRLLTSVIAPHCWTQLESAYWIKACLAHLIYQKSLG